MKVRPIVALFAQLLALAGCSGSAPTRAEENSPDDLIETSESELAEAGVLRTVHLATGVDLQYLEQGNEDGQPVIFLHGYTDSHHSFDRNTPRLPRRFHAFILDQRGHGGSSKPPCCYEQRDFSRDVIAFMDRLHIARAALVGHSMGSLIAHKAAADHPHRFDKLVLIGSAPTAAGNPGAIELKSAVDTLEDPIDPEFVRAFQASTFYRPIPAAFLDIAVSESLRVPAAIWKQALDGILAEDHTARLSRITADTLILWGDQDVFFSAADQEGLLSAIPRARLVIYRDTGHGLHVEQPVRFVRDLERFVR